MGKQCVACSKGIPFPENPQQRGNWKAKKYCSRSCRIRWQSKTFGSAWKRKQCRFGNIRFREACRAVFLKRYYGISLQQYDELLLKQNGVCAICGKAESHGRKTNAGKTYYLSVDHDHETQKVRGLLCNTCNRMLGLAKESPEIMNNALRYLHGGKK